jgi:hypothetical protein
MYKYFCNTSRASRTMLHGFAQKIMQENRKKGIKTQA